MIKNINMGKYINRCPKCGTYMIREIRWDKNNKSYFIYKCIHSACAYEMKVGDK